MAQDNLHSKDSSISATPADRQTATADVTESLRKIQFYQQLSSAEDMPGFLDQVLAVIKTLGFSDFSIGHLSALAAGSAENFYDSRTEWLSAYLEGKYYEQDMVLQHCALSAKPVFTSDLESFLAGAPFNTEQIECNRALIELNKSHGYHDCYHLPFKTHGGEGTAVLSLAAQGASQAVFHQILSQTGPVLYLLAEAIDYIGTSKFPDSFVVRFVQPEIFGASKPLQLLATLATKNLTLKEAAKAHFIGLDTANKHVAIAKKTLGVKTLPAAVYAAIKQGFIRVDEE